MVIKKNCNFFSLYSDNENKKGILRYISFKFLCLSLYVIGFYYVFLNNSLENKSLEIATNCNVYKRNLSEAQKNSNGSQRRRNLNLKNEDINKTKSDGNIKSNEQKVEENKDCTNNEMENNNMENKSNSSVNNINYNDLSKNLTKKELYDVLNSLEECPSNEDLRNIWIHTVGVVKEDLDNIVKELKASIQKYLDKDISVSTYGCRQGRCWLYESIWTENIWGFSQTVETNVVEYTNKFFSLINDEHTLDDILKFIYSFVEYFKTIKNELHEKHQKELLESIAKTLKWKK
ncbi:Plasmodium exported protein (PHIST), unknown function [Plasmodium sp. gorilla clade G2]|uniref:Plasmodium exported protein (PHIST), unknown function n=1 Tax=Plasmodium sp. gorilla clade G2 TaxID=880535 RepID=UPI000D29AC1F|nr:Plasmodium exported protein (PHIST), unknown function [Plasmodium sp. gorilla clade G2]SOV20177.1 Plasmodium exported protein (PHIST), unknown function [Plasmodium sp. gorilla clade G2]